MATAETCVVCGNIIPEGRQVCPSCEAEVSDYKTCWLCGRNGTQDRLEKHHIFGGANRDKSERYGLTVYLCGERCHRNGKKAAHKSAETMQLLHEYGQRKAMKEQDWTVEQFIREIGRNYLEV